MADDPIRAVFELLEREPVLPSRAFADALLERLEEERREPKPPIRRARTPRLSPRARRILVAAAALVLAALVIVPLLPLARDRARRPALPAGDVIWVRTFTGDGDVLFLDVAAAGSEVYASSVVGPDMYGLGGHLYRFGPDGHRVWGGFATVVQTGRLPIAAHPAGGVFVGDQQGTHAPLQRYDARGGDVLLEPGSFGRLVYEVEALAVSEAGVFVAGVRSPARVASMGLDGVRRWIVELPRSERARAIAVDGSDLYVVGTSIGGSPMLWTLDEAGAVTGRRTLEAGIPQAVAAAGGRVLVVQDRRAGASISAFDGATGTILWMQHLGSGTSADDVVADETGVYVAGTTGLGVAQPDGIGFVRALDTDGVVLWSSDVWDGGAHRLSLALSGSGLYVGGVVDGAAPRSRDRDGFIARVALGTGPPR